MLLGGLVATAAGVVAVAWGGSPWHRVRAGWRGMTTSEALRWDGYRGSPAKAAALRWGLIVAVCGVGLLVAAVI